MTEQHETLDTEPREGIQERLGDSRDRVGNRFVGTARESRHVRGDDVEIRRQMSRQDAPIAAAARIAVLQHDGRARSESPVVQHARSLV